MRFKKNIGNLKKDQNFGNAVQGLFSNGKSFVSKFNSKLTKAFFFLPLLLA